MQPQETKIRRSKAWDAGTGSPKRILILAMLGIAALCIGLVSNQSASAGVPTGSAGAGVVASASGSKLYGQLDVLVARSDQNTRLRVIVHMRDQVSLTTWPAGDRAGAIFALRAKASAGQADIRRQLSLTGMAANIYQSYWVFNGFAVEAPIATIRAMAARDDVDYILEDGYMYQPNYTVEAAGPDNPTNNWNIYQVRAPEVWALGYDGTGRVVANQDSGVEGSHSALASRWRGVNGGTPANSWLDPFGTSISFPIDEDSHGTHTMGTITGYQGDASGMNEIGQAKGATWIACRIYDATGKGPFSYIHRCFQFMVDPDGNPNTNDQPDSVGNSWGDSNAYQYPDLEWWPDIEAWRAVGIIPVFSNGNNGPTVATVGKPASYPIVIGVGNLQQNRIINGSSSRGPSQNFLPWNNPEYWERTDKGLIKPEVMAPGTQVRSSIPGNSYANFTGTSMASPHVTGLAGILRQIRPTLTVNEFYNIIIDTAFYSPTWGLRPNNNYGWGEIDDYAAAIYVRDAGAVRGPIMDGACNIPVVGAKVWVYDNRPGSRDQHVGIRKMVADNTGNYSTILAAGTYTVSVSAPGYYGMDIVTTVMSTTTSTLPITLNKMPTGTVSGTVSDGTNPVVGAVVSIDGLSNIRTTSGAGGAYSLVNVPAGNFTVRAEKCGYTPALVNITVTYPGSQVQNLVLGAPTIVLTDDFEDGDLAGWTVSGGSTSTGIWHNSDRRGYNSVRAARAGVPTAPYYYVGGLDTRMTSAVYDTASADRVWLSFDVYDDSESEYDIIRADISTDGGATWPQSGTVFGEASPIHGWQHICLDVTQFRSATMAIRFRFNTDGSNWNGEFFEGPSIDNVLLSRSAGSVTPVVPMTPTPGGLIPCTPVGATSTVPPATATNTAAATATTGTTATTVPTSTPCPITFSDVDFDNPFYSFIRCLACRGIISGFGDGTFRPNNPISRGQIAKMVSNAAGFNEAPGGQIFQDVDFTNPFYSWINRLSMRGHMGGYECNLVPEEPCVEPGNLPYFRPFANATRGQLAKIVANAAGLGGTPSGVFYTDVQGDNPFYLWVMRLTTLNVMSGYPCGGENEPCDDANRPYFRPYASVTRGQASKIVANTFYPGCLTPAR